MSEERAIATRHLFECWGEMVDDCGDVEISYIRGYLRAMVDTGVFNEDDVELWIQRASRCPGHENDPTRTWCAYCGIIEGSYIEDGEEEEYK